MLISRDTNNTLKTEQEYKFILKCKSDDILIGHCSFVNNHSVKFDNVRYAESELPLIESSVDGQTCTINIDIDEILCIVD